MSLLVGLTIGVVVCLAVAPVFVPPMPAKRRKPAAEVAQGDTDCPPHEIEVNILSKDYEAGFKAGMEFEAAHQLLSAPICGRGPDQLLPDWMRVAPGTDAAIWRPWSRETGEL